MERMPVYIEELIFYVINQIFVFDIKGTAC